MAVVAHPYWDVSEPEQVRDLVASLKRDVGLDGIETFYPPHTKEQTAHCLELCEELDLAPDRLLGLPRPHAQDVLALRRLRHLRPGRAAGAAQAVSMQHVRVYPAAARYEAALGMSPCSSR